MNRRARFYLPLLTSALVGACAVPYPYYRDAPESYPRAESSRVEYGIVSAVDRAQTGPNGAGAAVGGVIGAVIGRQIGGSGDARAAGTVFGAFIGAVVGNQIERQNNPGRDGVRISVRMDRGGERIFEQADGQELRIGDRVAVDNGRVLRVGRLTSELQSSPG